MAKPFKRYFTGSGNRAGKGDDRRDAQVSEQQVAENWCHAFGHKHIHPVTLVCSDCGADLSEAIRAEAAKVCITRR